MPAFTPAITSSNGFEVVRLNRSISIFFVISNLYYAQPRLPELHNSIAPAVLRPFSTARFTAANNAVLAEGAPVVRNGWNDRRFTAVADVEIRSSDRWQGEPRRRCNAPHYDERRHDSDPDSCRPSRLAS